MTTKLQRKSVKPGHQGPKANNSHQHQHRAADDQSDPRSGKHEQSHLDYIDDPDIDLVVGLGCD